MIVPRGLRLLLSAPFALYVCVSASGVLGSSLSNHAFDMQEIMALVSNKDIA